MGRDLRIPGQPLHAAPVLCLFYVRSRGGILTYITTSLTARFNGPGMPRLLLRGGNREPLILSVGHAFGLQVLHGLLEGH